MALDSIYEPLGKNGIRLIEILPCLSSYQQDETIRCRLKVASLDDPSLTYNALSYTWRRDWEYEAVDDDPVACSNNITSITMGSLSQGSQLGAGTIVVQSQVDGPEFSLTIRHNLLCALTRFREEAFQRDHAPTASLLQKGRYQYGGWLWIDALSINQEDIQERNVQVPQMLRIYQKAQFVICWLGLEPTTGLERLGEFLEDLGSDPGFAVQKLHSNLKSLLAAKFPPESYQDCQVDLQSIYQSKYWERIWVVQELLGNLASKVHVGRSLVDIYPLLYLGTALAEHEICPNELSYMAEIYLKSQRSYQFPDELLDLLYSCRRHECSDRHDKVYALIGLGSRQIDAPYTVDYSLSLSAMNKATASYLLRTSGRLNAIRAPEKYLCLCSKSRHLDSGLPSWVPDWNCRAEFIHMERAMFIHSSAHHWEFAKEAVQISANGNVLKCQVQLLGKVTKILGPIEDMKPSSKLLQKLLAFAELNTPPSEMAQSVIRLRCSQLHDVLFDVINGVGLWDHLSDSEKQAQTTWREQFVEYCFKELTIPVQKVVDPKSLTLDILKERIISILTGRALITINGHLEFARKLPLMFPGGILGIANSFVQRGDTAVLVKGCDAPIMLRPTGAPGATFTVVGDVHIEGLLPYRSRRNRSPPPKLWTLEFQEIEIH